MTLADLHDPALRERSVDRLLPIHEAFAPALPGLQPGRIVGCSGPAAMSLAVAVASRAVVTGAWLAAVGVPMLGVEAAVELGVPLRRMVLVDGDHSPNAWVERVAAVADGFQIIVTCPPRGAERVLRKVRTRLQARGCVLVVVGSDDPGMSCDVELATTAVEWNGLGRGFGRLLARRCTVRVGGRRMPRPVELDLWLPGADGRVALASSVAPAERDDGFDSHDVWSQAG